MDELVRQLAAARQSLAGAKTAYQVLVDEFNEREDVEQATSDVAAWADQVTELESLIRQGAEAQYEATREKAPHPAVKVRVVRNLMYEPSWALDWCANHLRVALKLDARLFEKHARAVQETAPIQFVKVDELPQVAISRDLTGYLDG